MKFLFKAALAQSRHIFLAVFVLINLLILTIANQAEIFSLGIMANRGTDFFTLFENNKDHVLKKDVLDKWNIIDKEDKGYITKQDASLFLSKHQKKNVLNKVLYIVSSKLNLEKNLAKLIILLVFVAIFKACFLFSSRYCSQILSIKVTKNLRMQFFKHIQSLPISFYHKHNIGALSARTVGDAGQIASSLNSCLINYMQTPFTILANLLACFYLSWRLSLVIFIGIPLIIFPVIFLTKKIKKVSRKMQRNQEMFTSVLIDFLSGIHTIKVFAVELFSFKKYKKQNDQMAHLEAKSAKYSLLTRPILHIITTSCLASIVIFGLYILDMSVAQLLVFCGLLHLFYEPIKKFAEENANIQKGVVAAERMFEVLNIKSDIQDMPKATVLKNFKDRIEFKKVSFRYKDAWVLKDINFFIEKGKSLAIVGPTGSGKSTIVQLIPRLYDVQKGEILIDGENIKSFTRKSLREKIAFVPQKPFLFYDSVWENISFGRAFSKEEIVDACKKAQADEFIQKLPQKYDTILEEAGKSLSGGQQQRLAIARALLKKSPILILDEATSSLDSIAENKISSVVEDLKDVSQIIIAHRLSTIANVDKIIYIEDGKKISEGTREELLKTCTSFKNMWDNFHKKQTLV